MKKKIVYTFILALGLIVTQSGCKKYENGPTISLSSKKSRIAADWEFKKVTYNDMDITTEFLGYTWEINKDETFKIVFENSVEDNGIWEFVTDKEAIDVKYSDGSIERYLIKQLKSKEMWLELNDFGNIIRMELTAK
jgi:hypothetical protein